MTYHGYPMTCGGEAFMTRFLPSWTKWRRSETWKKAFRLFVHFASDVQQWELTPFRRVLYRVWHRLNAPCTADESWTSYVMLSRQGIVNFNSAYSRQYDPHTVLDIYKYVQHFSTWLTLNYKFVGNRIIFETSLPLPD
jgi:hypothetical protein